MAIYSVSQVELLKVYLSNLDVTTGMYIIKIHDEIYVFDW